MECEECISGHSENCSNTEVAKLAGTGGFAQYVAVSGEKIRRGGIHEIPEDVSFDAVLKLTNGKGADKVISPSFLTEKFITHILPLDKINEGIRLTKTGEAIKVVLHPWE